MDPSDEYRPDPPTGLGYADFRAARARFLDGLARRCEVARLERAFALASPEDVREGGHDRNGLAPEQTVGGRPAAGEPS